MESNKEINININSSPEENIAGVDSPPRNLTPIHKETKQDNPLELLVDDSNNKEETNVRSYKRLSGSRRKRLQRLMSANMGYEEALSLSEKPWTEIPVPKPPRLKTVKRDREGESSKEHTKKAPRTIPPRPKTVKRDLRDESPKKYTEKAPRTKLPTKGGFNPTFSERASSFRVGIRDTEPMSEEQMILVHRSLIRSIADITSKGTGPKFLDLSHKPGWILVTCENQHSLDWLMGAIGGIRPWPEARLSIMNNSELPKSVTVTTFIPKCECESIQLALSLLRTQNEDLHTEVWKILHTREEAHGWIVAFALDGPSVEALCASNLRANLGFKKVTFRIKGGLERNTNSAAARDIMTPAARSESINTIPPELLRASIGTAWPGTCPSTWAQQPGSRSVAMPCAMPNSSNGAEYNWADPSMVQFEQPGPSFTTRATHHGSANILPMNDGLSNTRLWPTFPYQHGYEQAPQGKGIGSYGTVNPLASRGHPGPPRSGRQPHSQGGSRH